MDTHERDLLERLCAGDEASFERIFRKFYPILCGFAHSYVHSEADAEEIVQSVFLTIWSKRAELQINSSLKSYLFSAVRNQALNRSARARLEQRWYEQAERAAGDSIAEPVDIVEQTRVATRVREAIDQLPTGCRRVLLLRWEGELSLAEIADALAISIKGVENQLTRARKALKTKLSDLLD